jgi:nicotinate-nucleotide adenylyltransferase
MSSGIGSRSGPAEGDDGLQCFYPLATFRPVWFHIRRNDTLVRELARLNIGIFGGTFDPIHIGHLLVAEEARMLLPLDEVIFVPAGRPWLKADRDVTDAHHRLRMVSLATASNPCFRVSDVEVGRPGASYTIDTLEKLRSELASDTELYLVLGMDSLREIRRWRDPERIFELAIVVGMSRPGFENADVKDVETNIAGAKGRVIVLDGPLIDVSATDIRKRVADCRSIRYRVPPEVERYIEENGLYRLSS